MINHARTLLLNISGSTSPGHTYPGEEYVWPGYVSFTAPPELERIRNVLFGFGSDRAMRNYRLRQLLSLTHSTELGDYLTALDPRITYWPLHDETLFKATTYGASVKQLAGSTTWSLNVLGDPANKKSLSKLYDQWLIEVIDSSSLRVTHTLPDNEVAVSTYSGGGVSNSIALPGSSLQFNVGAGVLGAGNWPTWQLIHLAEPVMTLPDVYLMLKEHVESELDYLFAKEGEPFETCRQLWAMPSGPMAYKLGAVTVGLSYRLDENFKKQV